MRPRSVLALSFTGHPPQGGARFLLPLGKEIHENRNRTASLLKSIFIRPLGFIRSSNVMGP